jgi:hypothetical protein
LAGKYVLKAKNKHGEDSAEVQINVFGKPTAPTGPLNVRTLSLARNNHKAKKAKCEGHTRKRGSVWIKKSAKWLKLKSK